MKKIAFIIGLIVITIGNLVAQKVESNVVCFKSNMDCANCEKTLTEHLKFEKGVKDLKVDHLSNTIYIEYKGYTAEKISKADYDKVLKETSEKGHEHESEVHKVRK
jgi:periplasmic mercuric ion binding protein